MKKFVLWVSLALIPILSLNAQQVIFKQDIIMKSFFKDKRETLPVVNSQTGQLALVLFDNKDVAATLFNKNLEVNNKFLFNKPESKLDNLLGYSIKENSYNIFYTDNSKKKFLVQTLNGLSGEVTEEELNINMKNKELLTSFTHDNFYYLLTLQKKTSTLAIYKFEGNKLHSSKILDLSDHTFSIRETLTLFDILNDKSTQTYFFKNLTVLKVENDTPNPLEVASYKNKMYVKGENMYLTIDNQNVYTFIIKINLLTFDYQVINKMKPFLYQEPTLLTKSNSFLMDDILFQIKVNRQGLCIEAENLLTGELLRTYRANKDEDIGFKNSTFIYKSSSSDMNLASMSDKNEKELKNTSKVLKKMIGMDVGISVYSKGNNYEIIVGGFEKKKVSSGGGGVAPQGLAFNGGMPEAPMYTTTWQNSYNPMLYSYNQYTFSKSAYFKSKLNKSSFEHVEGDIKLDLFEKISRYEDLINMPMENNIRSKTIFKYHDYFVFGYYDKSSNTYQLIKFF